MLAQQTTGPTAEDRRAAVCRAMTAGPGLIRYAARFTRSIDDAEDAYQRAMEIALTRAPVTEPDAFAAWLHTVIRREAGRILDERRREMPAPEAEIDDALTAVSESPQPDAVVEWRDRYRAVQDAIAGLTGAQRVCLMLRSAGASREEIQLLTGFSERKVRRSIVEGRSRLQAWEVRMRAGKECERIADLIDRTLDESASHRERRVLSRHIRHCPSCRSRYRNRREETRLLGSLVPVALVGAHAITAAPPDPSLVMTWWERVSGSASVKVGQALQMVADVPASIASTKAGAGAIAAVAAGAIGAPLLMDTVRSERPVPRAAVVQSSIAVPPAIPPSPAVRPAPSSRSQIPRRTRTRTRSTPGVAAGASSGPTAPQPTVSPTATHSQAPDRRASTGPELEFSP